VRIPKVIELTVDPGDDGEPTRSCERPLPSHTLVGENSRLQANVPASIDEPFRQLFQPSLLALYLKDCVERTSPRAHLLLPINFTFERTSPQSSPIGWEE
jgi:hypothetical protein